MPSTDTGLNSSDKKLRDSEGRVSQFVYIRVISCFAIVLLHCINTSRAYYGDGLSSAGYRAAVAVCSLLMWAVPCFLMVTGALLLNPGRKIPLSRLFGKYIRRMVTALLVFTFIFTLIKYRAGEMQGSSSLGGLFISNLIKDQAMPHLWYLYLMIALYLMMPLFKIIVLRISDKSLWVLTAALVVAAGFFTFLPAPGMRLPGGMSPSVMVYPAYLFIGHLLFENNAKPHAALACFMLASILIFIAVLRASEPGYAFLISSYSSPLVVLQSSSLYSLMLRINAPAGRSVSSLDACGFGIYLVHMIFVRLSMKELGFNPYLFGPFAFLPMAIAFFSLSFAVVYVIMVERRRLKKHV